jgi:hypothetical protein
MQVKKMTVTNGPNIIDFDKNDSNFLKSLDVPNEVREVLKIAIIGGTDAWLSINNDEEHMKNDKRIKLGYKDEDDLMKDGPYGPYHEPKGNDIEKAML